MDKIIPIKPIMLVQYFKQWKSHNVKLYCFACINFSISVVRENHNAASDRYTFFEINIFKLQALVKKFSLA